MAGSNQGALTRGTYGQLGLPAAGNSPGERMYTVSWTDNQGNLWLFGNGPSGADGAGNYGFLDDVWEFNTSFGQWAWMAGSSTAPLSGPYGFRGSGGAYQGAVAPVFGTYQTPTGTTTPGGLQAPIRWTDKQGNLWLFSGFEYRIINYKTYSTTMNALWKFDVATHEWAWMGGSSNEGGTPAGVYGTLGQPAPGNTPGGRAGATTWIDSSGRFWLFGGKGFDAAGNQGYLNDLWMFDPGTLEWTWMAGSDLLPEQGVASAVYGARGVKAVGNTPPGLNLPFFWTDTSDNVWLFGGSLTNDLWELDSATHEWAWMGGSGKPDANSLPGNYGTRGVPAPSNIPGGRSRYSGYSWSDSHGNLWMFGGSGDDSIGAYNSLGDLWEFTPNTGLWTWMGGPTTFKTQPGSNGTQQLCESSDRACTVPGVYGTLGTPASANIPGTRDGAALWTDKSGNVWLFGGLGIDSDGTWGFLNDFWKFDSSVNEWVWMGGSSTVPMNGGNSGGNLGNYGTRGVFSPTNAPGSHTPAAKWTDGDGNLWIFGGSGCNQANCYSFQNDLWEYQLNAPAAPLPDFAIGVTPGSLTVAAGGSATSQVSTEVTNGFASPVNLAATAPAGITASPIPNTIAAASSSTMTVTADSTVALGLYTVGITGTGGGLSHSINLQVQVISSVPVATPVFTPAAGTYSDSQTVTISDATPGSVIHFTTDGSVPTDSSPIYSGPFTVTATMTLQAIAIEAYYPDSVVSAATFTISRPSFPQKYAPTYIASPRDPSSPLLADVNDDGLPDILYQDSSTSPATIQEALAQPDGSYTAGPVLHLPKGVGGCRTLDANHDGKIDLACVHILDEFDAEIATFLGNGDGTFQTPIYSAPMQSCVSCPAGPSAFDPWIFTPADIDQDGYSDLLVGDHLDGWTFVLLGDGRGRFTVASTITNIASDPGVTDYLVDVNGDGKLDLVSSQGPFVWLGNGDGTFKLPAQGGMPYPSCVLHDMDGDGILDAICSAAVTNLGISMGQETGGTELAILKGKRDGTFNLTPIATQTFGDPTGGYGKFYQPVGVYDVNGDGILDILAYSPDGFTVLLGQGSLKFAPPVHYATGFQAMTGEISSFFADMNHDGVLDEVAAGPDGIYITYGRKDGTFAAPPAYEVADVVGHIAVADFNGDGIPDIAATGDQSIELSVGNGDGTFKPFVALPNGGIDFSTGGRGGDAQIVHGDFNGDGKQDILAIGSAAIYKYDSYILFGQGNGVFAAPQLVPNSNTTFPAFARTAVVDVNKDGRDDVLTTDGTHIYSALSNGDGTFKTISTVVPASSVGLNPSFPAFADFNQDGKIDAVYGQGTTVFVVKGHGDGTFDTSATILPIPTYQDQAPPGGQIAVAAGDLDGDGHADIAVLVQLQPGAVPDPLYSPTASIAFVYYGNGDGTFTAPVVAGVFNRIYSGIYATDLNKDGRADLVYQINETLGSIYAPDGDAVGVQMSLPGRSFGPEQHYNGGNFETALAIADLNRDGYPDLLAVNSGFFPNGDFTVRPGNSVTELLGVGAPSSAHLQPTATAVATSKSSALAGAPVTFTAIVTNPTAGSGTPTGTVVFTDRTGINTTAALAAQSATTAQATFTTSDIAIGPDVVNATYSGDGVFASSGAQVSQIITGYPSAETVSASPNPATAGQAINFTATVANPPGSTVANPSGYIEFTDSATGTLGSSDMVNRSASATATLAAGAHTITAWYSGDALHASSTAMMTEAVYLKPTVTITAASSVLTNQDLPVTIAVSSGTSNIVPTGTIVVTGGGYTSAATALGNGNVAIDIPAGSLAAGNVVLTASYTPDSVAAASYLSASSATANVTVGTPPPSFSIGTTSVSVEPGATNGNTSTITVTPSSGFTGAVVLGFAVGTSPAGAHNPPTLSFGATSPVNISGASPGTATLTFTTTAPSTASLAYPEFRGLPWYGSGGAALACVLLLGIPVRRRRWLTFFGIVLLSAPLAFLVTACGGGGASGGSGGGAGGGTNSPGTTPGVYTFTITGQSGSINESAIVSLTVQ